MSDVRTLALEDNDSTGEPDRFAPETPVAERLRRALGEDYELGPQIGEGGMGIVFRAEDLRLKREVAIKVLPPEVTHRADLRKRFVREAQLAASLTHPNIVPIYDVGQKYGLAWFVMAYIPGESVRDLIRRGGPQPVHIAARVMREVAWALSYAHARGIVHRDIKPDNILIERASGRAMVTDFGLAKAGADEEDENLTHPGGVLGTPAYMAPEQASGRTDIDGRADIYSLGLVGYYMLAGRNAFEAANARAVMARIMTENAPAIFNVRPDAPTWLTDVIDKATQRDTDRRPARAEEMAEMLDRGESTKPIPTSVQYLLVWAEAYVELSVLAAWFFFIVGIPDMPMGSGAILACLLALPLLFSLQLVNAEGLTWQDVREGIVAWRLHMLRCLNLKREAGIHYPTVLVGALTFLGVIGIRFTGPILSRLTTLMGSWSDFTPIDLGPFQEGQQRLFQDPHRWWILSYAIFGSILWGRLFGLPSPRRITAHRLDVVASWRIPGWLDRLGAILLRRVRSSTRVIAATADFRQLAEPAVQAAIAFNRSKRGLRPRDRLRLAYTIWLGDMAIKRLWHMQERLRRMKDRRAAGCQSERADRMIAERENMLAEFASALCDLRMLMDDVTSPAGREDGVPQDERVIGEVKRLARPLRTIRKASVAFVTIWIATLLLGDHFAPRGGLAADVLAATLNISFLLFIVFQFFKRRLYT